MDIKELRNSELRKIRIQRAILDAKGYGGDPEEARQKEIEDIKEDFKITTEMIQVEKEMLKRLEDCLGKAQKRMFIILYQ